MRVTFYRNIKTRSGKCSNGKEVFMSLKKDEVCVSRIFTYPRISDHNRQMGSKVTNYSKMWTSVHDDFKKDLTTYANAYNSQRLKAKQLPISSYNVFMKGVMKYPTQLDDLSGTNGISEKIGETVPEWITNGYLPSVSRTNFLLASIVNGV